MLAVDVFCYEALMFYLTWLCVASHVLHGQQLIQDPTMSGDHHTVSRETGDGWQIKNAPTETKASLHHIPHIAPCLVDDIFAALREGVGSDGGLTDKSFALFGICTDSDNSSSSVLFELAMETSRKQRNRLRIVHPAGVLITEDDDGGRLVLTFDLQQPSLSNTKLVLILAFESPVSGGDLDVTFTSHSLQPNTQSMCISGETQYILLPGRTSEDKINPKWKISIEPKSPDMKQNLKNILIGGNSGSNISLIPLLLFYGELAADTRDTDPASSETFSFFCELKRLLGDLLPQEHSQSPPLELDSLKSLPPLTIGLSSSETLLAGLINSSSPTIFSFTRTGSTFQVHHGELALSPALLEQLRERLDQTVVQIQGIIREEDIDHRATERLRRLSVFPKKKPAAGESQYRAFFLLKALQTVVRAYEVQRAMRATRADPNNPVTSNRCGLKSLTVSLEKHVIGPNNANINNCHGSCTFPLINGNNHAVLLNSHLESIEDGNERAPCCVPVDYEALEVVDLNEHGTYLSIKPDMVAKQCGCR